MANNNNCSAIFIGNNIFDSCVKTLTQHLCTEITALESASAEFNEPVHVGIEFAEGGKIILTLSLVNDPNQPTSNPTAPASPAKSPAVNRKEWVDSHIARLSDEEKRLVDLLTAISPEDMADEHRFDIAVEIAQHDGEEIPDFS